MSFIKPKVRLSVSCVLYHTPINDVLACVNSLCESASSFDSVVDCYLIDNTICNNYSALLSQAVTAMASCDTFVIHLVDSDTNEGYGAANNSVATHLKSDFHLVINPDVVVEPEALLRAVNFLVANPAVGMVTPFVSGTFDSIPHVVKRYPDCLSLFVRFMGFTWFNRIFMRQLDSYACTWLGEGREEEVELAGGCFFFLRTGLFRSAGGFEPKYFLYFEDFDFCVRLRKYASIYYVPTVRISHSGGDVGRKGYKHHLLFIVSAVRFFSTHGWRLF